MVVIRLARRGSKKNPFYNIVVADQRRSRDGRFIERVGFYNPMARGSAQRLELAQERVQYWISKGAQPSDRVCKLVKEATSGETIAAAPRRSETRKAQADAMASKAQQAKKTEEKAAEKEVKAEEAEAKPAEEQKSEEEAK